MSDSLIKKIQAAQEAVAKARSESTTLGQNASKAVISSKDIPDNTSVFSQEDFINRLVGTGNTDENGDSVEGLGFTEDEAEAIWNLLNLDDEGESEGVLDTNEINFWVSNFGQNEDPENAIGNDELSISELLSALGNPDTENNSIDEDSLINSIEDFLESKGINPTREQMEQWVGTAIAATKQEGTTNNNAADGTSITIVGEEQVTGTEHKDDATQGGSTTDGTRITIVGEEQVTGTEHKDDATQGGSTTDGTRITIVGEEQVTGTEHKDDATQGSDKTDQTTYTSTEELFESSGLNGDIAADRVKAEEGTGTYVFTTDSWSNSKGDNLDCESRIMRNLYGVSYSDPQYKGCYEALSMLNGYGGNTPANARFEVYSLEDLQTAAALLKDGKSIDEIKEEINPLSEKSIKETEETTSEETQQTQIPAEYLTELNERLKELSETLDGNNGTDSDGLKDLVGNLALPKTDKVSVSAALQAAYYLTGGNSETLTNLLSKDLLTRDELAEIAENYKRDENYELQAGDIVFRTGADGTLLPATVYGYDESGNLLVVQGGQTTGNGTPNGIYIRSVEDDKIEYVIPCGQEAINAAAETTSEAGASDGASEAGASDGASEAGASDGASEAETSDGAGEAGASDGASGAETSDGASEAETPDGTSEITSEELKRLNEQYEDRLNEIGLNSPISAGMVAEDGTTTCTLEDGASVVINQDGSVQSAVSKNGITLIEGGNEIPYAIAAQNKIDELGINQEDITIDNDNGTISFNYEINDNVLNYIYKNSENGYIITSDLTNGTMKITEEYSNGEEDPIAEVIETYSDSSKTTLKSLSVNGNPSALSEEAQNAIEEFYNNHNGILEEHGIDRDQITKISMEESDGTKSYTLKLENGNVISISNNTVIMYGREQDTTSGYDNKVIETYTSDGNLSSIEINGNPDGLLSEKAEELYSEFNNYKVELSNIGIDFEEISLSAININDDSTTTYTLEDGASVVINQDGSIQSAVSKDGITLVEDGNNKIQAIAAQKLINDLGIEIQDLEQNTDSSIRFTDTEGNQYEYYMYGDSHYKANIIYKDGTMEKITGDSEENKVINRYGSDGSFTEREETEGYSIEGLTKTTNNDGSFSYTGELENGTKVTTEYDKEGTLLRETTQFADKTVITEYDSEGNIKYETTTDNNGNTTYTNINNEYFTDYVIKNITDLCNSYAETTTPENLNAFRSYLALDSFYDETQSVCQNIKSYTITPDQGIILNLKDGTVIEYGATEYYNIEGGYQVPYYRYSDSSKGVTQIKTEGNNAVCSITSPDEGETGTTYTNLESSNGIGDFIRLELSKIGLDDDRITKIAGDLNEFGYKNINSITILDNGSVKYTTNNGISYTIDF